MLIQWKKDKLKNICIYTEYYYIILLFYGTICPCIDIFKIFIWIFNFFFSTWCMIMNYNYKEKLISIWISYNESVLWLLSWIFFISTRTWNINLNILHIFFNWITEILSLLFHLLPHINYNVMYLNHSSLI